LMTSERYTKDLEHMLRRLIISHNDSPTGDRRYCAFCWLAMERHSEGCLIVQAKALLESTGYTEDF